MNKKQLQKLIRVNILINGVWVGQCEKLAGLSYPAMLCLSSCSCRVTGSV